MIDILADHKEDVLDMRRRGISKKEISLTFHVCAQRVSDALNDWGDPFPIAGRKRLENMKDKIVSEWRGGATRKELAAKYGVCIDTMQRKLREWGESKPRGGRYNKYEMQRLRDAGLSGEKIAERLGCASQTVYSYTQAPATKEPPKVPEPKEFKPGEKYGHYKFITIVQAQRPLWLFQHRAGWKETFTELQLREAKVV